jgi:hypothetical protein
MAVAFVPIFRRSKSAGDNEEFMAGLKCAACCTFQNEYFEIRYAVTMVGGVLLCQEHGKAAYAGEPINNLGPQRAV